MDIRKSEEFRLAQLEKIAQQARQEISARNILTNYHYNNTLKDKVFEEYKIGTLGMIPIFALIAAGVSAYSMTGSFARKFPRAVLVIGQEYAPRVVLMLMTFTAGRSYEQYLIEHKLAADAYKEYRAAQDYYDSLKARRLESLTWEDRLRLLTGLKA